jgi:hypothetical protein
MLPSLQFDQIQVRETEVPELKYMESIIPCQVKVRFHQSIFLPALAHYSSCSSILVRLNR